MLARLLFYKTFEYWKYYNKKFMQNRIVGISKKYGSVSVSEQIVLAQFKNFAIWQNFASNGIEQKLLKMRDIW